MLLARFDCDSLTAKQTLHGFGRLRAEFEPVFDPFLLESHAQFRLLVGRVISAKLFNNTPITARPSVDCREAIRRLMSATRSFQSNSYHHLLHEAGQFGGDNLADAGFAS